MKRVLNLIIITSVLILLCTGCKSSSGEPSKQVLRVWSFTDELNDPIARFEERNPGVTIEYTIVPNEEYLNKIRPVLKSGKNAPDVFTGEMALVKELVRSGFWDNLDDAPYNADVSELVPYQIEMATDSEGKLRALSWQTTPGGFFYRRSIAKKYLGTDDPEQIGTMLSTIDGFLKVGRTLKEKSNGKIKLIPNHGDFRWYPMSLRKKAFFDKNNNFYLDPVLLDYFDLSKILRDEKLIAETPQWSPSWFEGMKKESNTFGYILPTWGLHYVLKKNAPDSSGDWGLTKGPSSYFWGGTWLGIYSKSKNKELAWQFVKMMSLDHDTLKWWAKKTGDFVGNQVVFNEIKDSFSEEYLGGQNHYAFFAREAPNVNASLITHYDGQITTFMMNALTDYIEGNKTKDEAVRSFKESVKSAYPEINID